MKRKEMIRHLESIGISEAIVDKNAMVNNTTPAILLRRNDIEEFYTGFDLREYQPDYQQWLISTFSK